MPEATMKTADPAMPPRAMLSLPEAPTILHILASRADRDTVAEKLDWLAAGDRFALRPAGPGKWLVLCAATEAPRLMAELREALANSASLLDQSDGRVLIAFSGSEAHEALAKGTGVDLDPSIFPIGHSAITAFGHVTVHLTHTGADAYELIVLRSYAEALWEALSEAAREFG